MPAFTAAAARPWPESAQRSSRRAVPHSARAHAPHRSAEAEEGLRAPATAVPPALAPGLPLLLPVAGLVLSLSLTDPIPPAAAEHAATARMRTRTE